MHRTRTAALLLALALAVGSAGLSAQTLTGTIYDARNLTPVPGTLVRLLDQSGSLRALTIADDDGRFQIRAPQPGRYTLIAARLGIEDYRSDQVHLPNPDEVYELNLTVVPSAIALQGLEVNAVRNQEITRALRLQLGQSPATLRNKPIMRGQIEEHAERGRRMSDIIRNSNVSGMEVRVDEDGYVCFLLRRGECSKIFLDNAPIPGELVDQIPLELLEAVVIVGVGETRDFQFEGSVMLFTMGFLGTEG